MDYGYSERRKTKKDMKKKRLARAFKHGGRFRTMKISDGDQAKRS